MIALYHALELIPPQRVVSYKHLAEIFNTSPRVVGKCLHQNQDPKIPCFRVVRSDGSLASGYRFGGMQAQRQRLKNDGVPFVDEFRVDPKSFFRFSRFHIAYLRLFSRYGDPGRWPWHRETSFSSVDEIVVGAILTQNTAWSNVEKAIGNIKNYLRKDIVTLSDIQNLDVSKLQTLIRPAGYYRQKTLYLKNITQAILKDSLLSIQYERRKDIPVFSWQSGYSTALKGLLRKRLLDIKGVGKETADVLLTYAFNIPSFVIDSYTKRFVRELKLYRGKDTRYDTLQRMFERGLDTTNDVYLLYVYQRFHALIVLWGKEKR